MKTVEVIEWTGMSIGQRLEDLPDDLINLLIEQGKVKLLEEDVKISKRSRNKGGDFDTNTGESVVEGNEV
jgi:hypothetical protein